MPVCQKNNEPGYGGKPTRIIMKKSYPTTVSSQGRQNKNNWNLLTQLLSTFSQIFTFTMLLQLITPSFKLSFLFLIIIHFSYLIPHFLFFQFIPFIFILLFYFIFIYFILFSFSQTYFLSFVLTLSLKNAIDHGTMQ